LRTPPLKGNGRGVEETLETRTGVAEEEELHRKHLRFARFEDAAPKMAKALRRRYRRERGAGPAIRTGTGRCPEAANNAPGGALGVGHVPYYTASARPENAARCAVPKSTDVGHYREPGGIGPARSGGSRPRARERLRGYQLTQSSAERCMSGRRVPGRGLAFRVRRTSWCGAETVPSFRSGGEFDGRPKREAKGTRSSCGIGEAVRTVEGCGRGRLRHEKERHWKEDAQVSGCRGKGYRPRVGARGPALQKGRGGQDQGLQLGNGGRGR